MYTYICERARQILNTGKTMDEILRDLKFELARMVSSEPKTQKHFMGVELEDMDKETLVLIAQYYINKECSKCK